MKKLSIVTILVRFYFIKFCLCCRQLLRLFLLGLTIGMTASAQGLWTGGAGTTNWNDGANWASGTPPVNIDAQIGLLLYTPNIFPLITAGQIILINDLFVGYDSQGQLTIESGSILGNLGYIGFLADSVGTVSVDGSESTLAVEDDLHVGYQGEGTLSITGGALVDSNQEGFIGSEVGSVGSVLVRGPGSQLDIANSLSVGGYGTGTLTFETGGLVATGGTAYIGEQTGSDGKVIISGVGSRWSVGGNVIVGNNGQGELIITDRGQLINGGFAYAGYNAGATGRIIVSGTSTRWNAPSNLFVGFSGTGSLTITEGAIVSGTTIRVADQAGSVGTINIGAAVGSPLATPGSLLTNNLILGTGDGRIVFNHTDTSEDYSFAPIITGNGQVDVYNGTTTFYQGSSYTGTTTIHGGTLIVDNTTGSATGSSSVNIESGGTLRGDGFITGSVIVDGVLAPGRLHDFGVLTLGALTLNSGATTEFRLTNPFAGANFVENDRVDVLGNLILGGTLDATISAAGVYRLFNYGGSLSGSFANEVYTSGRPGFVISNAVVDTSINGQVNLGVLSDGQIMQFWDGANTTPSGQAQGAGGSAIWNSSNTNWTNESGNSNGFWGQSVGVFAGTTGQVLIDGDQAFDTLQFLTSGYNLDAIAVGNGSLVINAVEGGTLNLDSATTTTINAPIVDGLGSMLLVTNGGTLILNGSNTYSGGTTVYNSIVQVGADENLGATTGGVTLEGSMLRWGNTFDLNINRDIDISGAGGIVDTNGFNTTIAQGIMGDGSLFFKDGLGTLTLTGNNSYTSETVVRNGILSLSGSGQISSSEAVQVLAAGVFDISQTSTGAIIKDLLGSGSVTLGNQFLTINSADRAFSGNISGVGGINLTGGVLTLSGANAYTGITTIGSSASLALSGGGQIAQSEAVSIDESGDFDISNTSSGTSIINLIGSGNVGLGNQALTITAANGVYAGTIEGTGSLTMSDGTLTLSGINTYTGGTSITAGRLIATNNYALGTGTVTTNGVLELDFSASGMLSNVLLGTGSIEKTGTATARLNGVGSTVGSVNVAAGTLALLQTGVFNAGNYNTDNAATTTIGGDSQLAVTNAFTQASGSTLSVVLGANDPIISADTASLSGDLVVAGFTGTAPNTATGLTSNLFTILTTTGGIAGNFSSVDFGSAASSVDYLTLAGAVSSDTLKYQVGFGLTWNVGTALGDGIFTLTGAGDSFDVDVALANQTGPFVSGWNGQDLTKNGAGTLILSGANTYSGTTSLNAGVLQTGINNAFSNSSAITVSSGATLNLADYNQVANNLSGAGNITLGIAALTLNNTTDTAFSGVISGGLGSLVKTGGSQLTLSGLNSTVGTVSVTDGTLVLAQAGVLNAGSYSTGNGATTTIGGDSQLAVTNAFTQVTGSTLSVVLGANDPIISADTASLSGNLTIAGFTSTQPNTATGLASTLFTILTTTGGIVGDFSSVDFGSAASSVDYLTLAGAVSSDTLKYQVGFGLTWNAGAALGDGIFTLTGAGDSFDVDVVLADQTGPFVSGWNGQDLTKNGAGTLILSGVNTYTGTTTLNAGVLQTGINNAFSNSSAITVNSGATLSLDSYDQVANNLSGAGNITLGTATLTVDNTIDTIFSGEISGAGSLVKTGSNQLTLSGSNVYAGGTTINAGRLVATTGSALGTEAITTGAGAILELNFSGDSTLSNVLAGAGTLEKTGSFVATLTGINSTVGTVSVSDGTLALAQTGTLSVGDYSTDNGATTTIGGDSQLAVTNAFTQVTGSTLSVVLGGNDPIISADTASLSGDLVVAGFTGTAPNTATGLTSNLFTILTTTGGISGDFSSVSFGSAASSVDYLTLAGAVSSDTLKYQAGFGLTWNAGAVLGDGIFTLTGAGDTFDVDVVLADQAGPFVSGWNGSDLTKNGAGTLILSGVNTYTGTTTLNAGILQTGINNTFSNSSAITVNSGATLSLDSYDQVANNLSGAGNITLGTATLTVDNTIDTIFSGEISGTGSLVKTGSNQLTLSGSNVYTGGTTINAGRLIATIGSALGTEAITTGVGAILELNFSDDSALSNVLAGAGTLEKTGLGTASLTGSGSTIGDVLVSTGKLSLSQTGAFNVASYQTSAGAVTDIGDTTQLLVANDFVQSLGSELHLSLGGGGIPITAETADLNGILFIDGFTASTPTQASSLPLEQYTIISTTNGITNNFSEIDFGGAESTFDYLTLVGAQVGNDYNIGLDLTWNAGTALGDGIFTLTGAGDSFDVDVVLTNQTGPFVSGWNGQDLTKNGAGTLILSGVNTYTGTTTLNAGVLQTGINNTFSNSSAITVDSGATLSLDSYDQIANNLAGGGNITLGSAALTVDNTIDTIFSGEISGTGSLVKTGSNQLTLSGSNVYAGGTTINAGRLVATTGSALGTEAITTGAGAILELNFSGDSTLSNVLAGAGTLEKTGSFVATLTGINSTVGTVSVSDGTLALAQTGTLSVGDYSTDNGATTTIGGDSQLAVTNAFTQVTGSTLSVVLGANDPIISADTASLSGDLVVAGFTGTAPNTATGLTSNLFTILTTTGGISGDFSSVDFGSAASSVDYLTLAGAVSSDTLKYQVGFGLTWNAGTALGDGIFTLTGAGDTFDVDVVLANQTGPFVSGWNGSDLTKNGAGTLILSGVNTYTGTTTLNAGVLQTGINNTFSNSSAITVNSGATLSLDSYDQVANNLSGAGNITLGTATLTVDNTIDTIFSGEISGAGSLVKTGSNQLTLSGSNVYTGGTTINAGRLIATIGSALGTEAITTGAGAILELNFSGDGVLSNVLVGAGTLEKTGLGTASLTGSGSTIGDVLVSTGKLSLSQTGAFNVASYQTSAGAVTDIGDTTQLLVANDFVQSLGSELHLSLGGGGIPITAETADLNGILFIDGFTTSTPTQASSLPLEQYTIISTTNGITNNFSEIDFGGAESTFDYLTLVGAQVGNDYNIGLDLTWSTGTALGDGIFTLTGAGDTFDVDVALANQTGPFVSGWNGQDLTKNGAGTLILSGINTYTGNTVINAGTLAAGRDNVFINSTAITVGNGATLNLNNYDQIANNLAGSGDIILGSAALTVNNTINTTFSGKMTGAEGSLIKTGGATLSLGGENTYTGITHIVNGTLEAMAGADNIIAKSNAVIVDANFIFNDTDQLLNNLAGTSTGNINLGTGTLTANNSVDTIYDGVISNLRGNLTKTGAATLTLTNTNPYVGRTDVQAGTLALTVTGDLSGTIGGIVSSDATLGGYGHVAGTINNEGTIAIANAVQVFAAQGTGEFKLDGLINNRGGIVQLASGASIGNRLTINGNYSGNGGAIVFNTQLGDDRSPTDTMVVGGDTSGSTLVFVNNQGGYGAQTYKGIPLIQVAGISDPTAFNLANSVVAGAYEYVLVHKNQVDGAQGWYLSSNVNDIPDLPMLPDSQGENSDALYRPDAGVNLGNQQGLINSMIPGLGHNNSIGVSVGASGGLRAAARLSDNTSSQKSSSLWSFITANQANNEAAKGQIKYDTKARMLQMGSDTAFGVGEGLVQIGLMSGYGTVDTDSHNRLTHSSATGTVKGYSVGVYGTWFMDGNSQYSPYIDAYLMHGRYTNEVSSFGNQRVQYNSNATSFALQAGIPIALGGSIVLEPQAQLTYLDYTASDYIDHSQTRVTNEIHGNTIGRVGAYLYSDQKIKPYAVFNVWYYGTKAVVKYDGVKISGDRQGLILDARLGFQTQVTNDLTVWGQVGIRKGRDNFEDVGGALGLKYRF